MGNKCYSHQKKLKQNEDTRQKISPIPPNKQENLSKNKQSSKVHEITYDNSVLDEPLKSSSIIIKINHRTKKLQGIPSSWLKNSYCSKDAVDEEKVIDMQILSEQKQDDVIIFDDTFDNEDGTQKQSKMLWSSSIMSKSQNKSLLRGSDIVMKNTSSSLLKFSHTNTSNSQILLSDLSIDSRYKYGVKNLSQTWTLKLQASGIKSNDTIEHPSILIDLINSQQLSISLKSSLNKQPLITQSQFQEVVHDVQVIYYDPLKIYSFRKMLGRGAMCEVFEAVSREKFQDKYAVRVMKYQKPQNLLVIQQEIAIMKLCQSKNIVQHKETYYYKQCVFMFIEFMDGGSLTQLIDHSLNRKSEAIPQQIIAYIIRQILKGIEVLHRKRRIHRDLKSDNILLNTNGEVKIADFGFAAQLTRQKQKRNTLVGTPCWMAPELILKSQYTEKADIWSIGVIIVEMVNGEPSYLRMAPLKAMYQIASKDIPKLNKSQKLSENLINFYESCMIKDPQERASCSKLLKHPFLTQINQQTLKQRFSKYLKENVKSQT